MIGEVISIGDELTSGQRLDTNSQWLSERLGELGIRVMYHTTVADDLAANIDVFRKAAERADIVVSTGGLGPTADDLTRDALAAVIDKPLEMRQEAMDHIRGLFARRNRPMPERNVVQAMFPQGSSIVHNPEGTAPGIHLVVPKPQRDPCHIIALPGVPAEMKQMWHGSVQEVLKQMRPTGRVIRHRRFKCFGAGESQLEAMLPDIIRRGRDPQVGITVHDGTITLRITAADTTPAACLTRMDETIATIHQCLGSLVFGTEDDELEDAVVRLLDQQAKTLATVEWATGGLLSLWLAKVDGAERWYLGGDVVTGNAAAVRSLDVPEELVAANPYSAEVAAAMANTVARRTGADLVLAIGAGPPVDEKASAPELYLALIADGRLTTRAVTYGYHSAIRKALVAKQALNLVRLTLLNPGAE